MTTTPHLIRINRSANFDPVAFVDDECSIIEQDEQALLLTEVDLNRVNFETMVRPGETSIPGEEMIRRLKKGGHIRLDAQVLDVLFENQLLIPERWKSRGYIFFDGTIFWYRNDFYVACMCWFGGEWGRRLTWIGHDRGAFTSTSACLAS